MVVAAAVGLVGAWHLDAARGFNEERVNVSESKGFSGKFPPLVGNTTAVLFVEPRDCFASPACATFPLRIVPPADRSADFSVRVEVGWKTPTVGDEQTNNIDLYAWDDPYPAGAAPILRSTSNTNQPERVTFFRPLKETYSLVVANATGVNDGYSVKISFTRDTFESPFEVLASPLTSRRGPDALASTIPSTSLTVPPGSVLFDAAPDSDFDEVAAADDGGDGDQRSAPVTLAEPDSPGPVSAAALLFASVVVPAAAVAGVVVWLRRRNPTSLGLG